MRIAINSFEVDVTTRSAYLRLPLLGALWAEWQGFGLRPRLAHERVNGERLLWAGPVHLILTPEARA